MRPPLRVVDGLYDGVDQAAADESTGLATVTPTPSELDAAHFFAERCGDRIRYCEKMGGWLVWDGRQWKVDNDGAIYRLADEATVAIAELAGGISDFEQRKKAVAFATNLRRRRSLDDIVRDASRFAGIAIGEPDQFDADASLLNVQNGIVDLRSGSLLAHDPQRLITKLVPITYEPQATCERWLRFLNEVFAGDANLIAFLQRAIGYSLTGSTRERCFFVLHGSGHNGKSTFVRILAAVSGGYHAATSTSSFVDRKSGQASNDIARLAGARTVTAIETGDQQRLNENLIKSLTGGDKIAVRFLYKEFFEFVPSFKWWLATNYRPTIQGTDEGIWSRVRLIPFGQQFTPEDDPALDATLDSELNGILAWAVAGAIEWHQTMLGTAKKVAEATASYRNDMDVFGDFIAERCVCTPTAVASAADLFKAYREWAEATGEKTLSQKWFGLRLVERGFKHGATHGRKTWRGIGLREQ